MRTADLSKPLARLFSELADGTNVGAIRQIDKGVRGPREGTFA